MRAPHNRAAAVTLPLRDAPRLPPGQLCAWCGKHRYATEQTAERMIRRLQLERGDTGRVETRAYYVHGWWHITSEPERSTTNV